jgi:hypothetical protein
MKKIVFNELFPYEMVRDYFFPKERKVEEVYKTSLKKDTYEESNSEKSNKNCTHYYSKKRKDYIDFK